MQTQTTVILPKCSDVSLCLDLIQACGPVSLGSIVHELKTQSLDNSPNWEERAQAAIDTLVGCRVAEQYDDTDSWI